MSICLITNKEIKKNKDIPTANLRTGRYAIAFLYINYKNDYYIKLLASSLNLLRSPFTKLI